MNAYIKKLLYLLILVSGCLSSCKPSHYPIPLAKAEENLTDSPDSTLYYLSFLENNLNSLPEENRMYYHLLKTGAEDKLYIKHCSDSLMQSIVRFYENYGNPEKLMLAYYYLGSTFRDMNDAPKAIHYYQKATDIGENIPKQHTLLSIIYGQIGDLLAYQCVYDESLVTTQKALNICKRHNDSIRYPYLLRNIARMWEDTNKDSMLSYYHAAYQQALRNKKNQTGNIILGELGAVYYSLGEKERAKNILLELIQKENISAVELLCLGKLYYSENKLDSANYYLTEVLKSTSARFSQKAEAYKKLAKIKEQQGNLPEALNYSNNAIIYFDSVWNTTSTEAVAKVNALYNYQHTEQINLQLKQKNYQKKVAIYQISIALFIIILIFVCAVIYLRQKKETAIQQEKKLRQQEEKKYRQSKAYIEDNKRQLAKLNELLQQAAKENNLSKQQLLNTQKELLELTNKQAILVQSRNELQEEHLEASPIYKFFHKGDGSNIKVGDEEWQQLQNTIDALYNGFTEKLYSLYPSISEMELRICYLIKIKVPPTSIAHILKRGVSAVSMTRGRLYEKMHGQKGTASLFDNFINSL